MILDFRGRNFFCEYLEGKYYHKEICFSKGCERGIINNYTHITIIWPRKSQKCLNYCFLDKKTLIEYFTEISRLLGFKLITLTENRKVYKLQFECIPDRRYFIYISMCIRYVYEHPFGIFLYAAWNNRKNFPELDIIQIIHFYLGLFFNDRPCHCAGKSRFVFYNIKSKCQFSLLRDNFNDVRYLCIINTIHSDLYRLLYKFNLKQLPQLINGINSIANKYYAENKKRICRW